jgi:hypothetical protein
VGNRAFECGLSRLAPRPARRPWAAAGCFFLPLRLDRRDPVAGVALVNVDERAQSDSGQLSDPDRAYTANLAARRQASLWMRYEHIEKSLNNKGKHLRRLAIDCILIVEMKVRKTTRKPAHSGPASIFCHQIDPGPASKQHTVWCKLTTPARDHTAIPPDPFRTDSNL